MSRLLAIEWDAVEVRFALVRLRGRRLAVERLGSFSHGPGSEGELSAADTAGPSNSVAAGWRAKLGRQRMARPRLLVGVERSRVEMRQFTVPPATDAELPELVRLQAMREAGFLGEDAVLDFFPLADDPTAPRQVEAVALAAEQLTAIESTCAAAGWTPERLLLRPYAAASAFRRLQPSAPEHVLLVEVGSGSADLLVLAGSRVLVARSVRLGASDENRAGSLVSEIRRTLVAIANRAGSVNVEAVYLCGAANDHKLLADQLSSELTMPLERFDPLEGIALVGEASRVPPSDTGRHVALLGMLLDEASGEAPAVDFLNPRRVPQPVNRRLIAGLAAAVVAAIVLAGGYVAWSKFAEADEQIAKLVKKSKDQDELVRRADAKRAAVEEIGLWAGGEVVWLDELRDLSLRFPSARDAVLLRLTMSRSSPKGATVDMQGLVRDPSIVGRMESNLRDEHHEVRSKRVQATIQERSYTWQFESSLSVTPRARDDYRTRPTEVAAPVVPAPATTTERPARAPSEAATTSTAAQAGGDASASASGGAP